MSKNPTRPSKKAVSFALEELEGRIVLSGAAADVIHPSTVEVAGKAIHKAATQTTVSAVAGTLGQPIAFSVTVRAPVASGAPQGTVNIVDRGKVIATLTLAPTTSTDAKYAYSRATLTGGQQAGGAAYYFGKHAISAVYVPNSGAFAKSTGHGSFSVSQPTYTALANGVEVATIQQGSGAQIQTGQRASVLYTGYLAKNGKIFDDSINDGGSPFSFTLGAGDVIPGFDEGTVGMQVGETRIIEIPPAEGYGTAKNGPIPGNSTLIFLVTLESIS